MLSIVVTLLFSSFSVSAWDFPIDSPWNFQTDGATLTNFTELQDTPSSYSGQSGKCLTANSGETGLEFVNCANASGSITAVNAGNGLTGGGSSGDVTLNVNDTYIIETVNSTGLIINWSNLFQGLYCLVTGCNMTGNIDMGGNNITNVSVLNFSNAYAGSHIQFNTSEQNIERVPGLLTWNADDGTLDLGLDSNAILQIGQEQHFKGVNKYGSTLSDGTAVYISGVQGNRPTIAPAVANDSDKFWVVGVVTETCLNNAECYVTTEGIIRNLNTSMWVVGDNLYLDEDNPGQLTNTHPTRANSAGIVVALVTNSHATQGSIQVTTPQYFAIGNNYDGQLRYSIINKNNGTNAMSLFTTVNDAGHRASFGIVGSNHGYLEPEAVSIYNEGYAFSGWVNDGNVSWIWQADPTDSHNFSFVNYHQMELTALGDLNISGDFSVPSGSINASGNVTASYFFGNISQATGINLEDGNTTGQMIYWNGSTWLPIASTDLFWNNTNKSLGIGTNNPEAKIAMGSGTPSGTQAIIPNPWGLYLSSNYDASFNGYTTFNGPTYISGNYFDTPLGYMVSVYGNSLGLDSPNSLILTRFANRHKNADHGTQANPTLFIQSATDPDTNNTQWVSLTHDTTNAVFGIGTGNYIFENGNVGIGTNTPNAKLGINGSALIQGDLNVTGSINQTSGDAFINEIYGELNGHDAGVQSFASANVYYNLTNLTNGLSNGITLDSDNMTIIYNGVYEIRTDWGFSGTANNQYEMSLYVNGDLQNTKCHKPRVMGTAGDTGSASFICLLSLTTGDVLKPAIENIDSAGDPTIQDFQMIVRRIGN